MRYMGCRFCKIIFINLLFRLASTFKFYLDQLYVQSTCMPLTNLYEETMTPIYSGEVQLEMRQ